MIQTKILDRKYEINQFHLSVLFNKQYPHHFCGQILYDSVFCMQIIHNDTSERTLFVFIYQDENAKFDDYKSTDFKFIYDVQSHRYSFVKDRYYGKKGKV